MATRTSRGGAAVTKQRRARDEAEYQEQAAAKRHKGQQLEQPALQFRHSWEVQRPGVPKPINLASFRFADKPSPPLRADDQDGHYVYELGANISSRYKILSKFGEGTFGRVLECWDRSTKDFVAVKIVRNVDKYRHAAMIELEVLNTLERNDPDNKRHCVKLKEWFDYRGHVCMVFEKLGPSLFDFLRRNDYQPFPMSTVQSFAVQLLEAVAYLHELNLVHTDLKPENILLMNNEYLKLPPADGRSAVRRVPRTPLIRVIDFGSATFEDQYHSSIVSTRHYRAPEVILGLGWSFPCDMWSVGCILFELATGDALFQTHENLEHLAMMEQVLGPIPVEVSGRADKGAAKLFVDGRLHWPEQASSKKSIKQVQRLAPLRQLLLEKCEPGAQDAAALLADLVGRTLAYDARVRISAAEALQHPFFSLHLPAPEPSSEVASGGGAAGPSSVGMADEAVTQP